MGLFNKKPKLKNINGYIIDELNGRLIDVPKGLAVYTIPGEVRELDSTLNLVDNKVLANMRMARAIIFKRNENGCIEKIPEKFFTFTKFPNLESISLPFGIKQLGDESIDITEVKYNFPTSLEYLGKNMYPETQKLVIENGIKELGNAYASHDTNLISAEVAGTVRNLPDCFVNQCKNLRVLILHNGVKTAGNYAFRGLNSLEYVKLPESFESSFETSFEFRPLKNKRGCSEYIHNNSEQEQNAILTIIKSYDGVPYTFQVRRYDFRSISFSNGTAIIKSNDQQSKVVNIDLCSLAQGAICQVDLKEGSFNQLVLNDKKTSIEDDIIDNGDDDQVLEQFQYIYRTYIMTSPEFKSLQSPEQKKEARKELYRVHCDMVAATINIPCVVLYANYRTIVEGMNKKIKLESETQITPDKEDLEH